MAFGLFRPRLANKMVEMLETWTTLILALASFLAAINLLLKNLSDIRDNIPDWLMKFLTLFIPNTIIIWRFFYFAGLYSNRLSEPIFFWSMIIQSALGVSAYVVAWLRWIYPRLQRIPEESRPPTKPED